MALPASTSAAVIGSDLGGAPIGTGCPAGCVVVQERIAGSYVEVGRANAVVTGWSTRGAEGLMALRVYRHRPNEEFTPGELHVAEVGQSADQTGNAGTQSFPARISVEQGDYIALVVDDGGAFGSRASPPPGTVAFRVGNFDVVDSTSPEPLELYLQARVEPDVDADGLGDETQDLCVRCGGQVMQPTPRPKPDPYASVRTGGPRVSIAGRARASRKGVLPVKLTNPYAFELKGQLTLNVGKKKVGVKRYSLPAGAVKAVKVKLGRSAFRSLKRRRSLRAVAHATVKAPAGPTRHVSKKLKLLAPKGKKRKPRRSPAPPTRQPVKGNATFRGKTEQGFSITIRTSPDGRSLSTFATTATTASCLVNGSPVNPQTASILPPVPIPLGGDGSFAIDKPNEAEDNDPNYRITGRLTGNTISGFFAWRRHKLFSNELCVTRELKFTATRG